MTGRGGARAAMLVALVALVVPVGAASATTGTWSMASRFAREVTRPGDRDLRPSHIEHVRELQYRLRWLGLFPARVNGVFGTSTGTGVKAFQDKVGLPTNGSATHATWAALIKATIRRPARIPAGCHASGWHACYDRWRHQLTLFHHGVLRNAWLVRGGKRGEVTRVGRFVVFRRYRHHVSSLPGHAAMPYSQFFSGGEAIHGSRRMVDPFSGHSHGCINMYLKDARQLWRLTHTHRLIVHVYGRWS
ncbi:MAG: L,D-transpeptidase family protein [Nocardioidaceae bacterium]